MNLTSHHIIALINLGIIFDSSTYQRGVSPLGEHNDFEPSIQL